jgi:hypothetical protein
MLDVVAISNLHVDSPDSRFDVGFLAETMLFYGHVHAVANRGTLTDLAAAFGAELLIEYLEERLFTMTYVPSISGVRTQNNVFMTWPSMRCRA